MLVDVASLHPGTPQCRQLKDANTLKKFTKCKFLESSPSTKELEICAYCSVVGACSFIYVALKYVKGKKKNHTTPEINYATVL